MSCIKRVPVLRFKIFLPVIVALALSACGGGGGSTDTAPTVLSQSPVPRLLHDDEKITIVFSESMDTSSFILEGDLADQTDGGVWSQTSTVNDTLTITPASVWSADTRHSLKITANDLAGKPLSPLTLSYDTYSGTAYYVNQGMSDDSLDGLTPATTKKTIMAAVNAATSPATVFVQSGTYVVDGTSTARIVLKQGVSLFGGYNADFSARVAGDSSIIDAGSDTTSSTDPSYAVLGNSSDITKVTILDGFSIQGATNTTSYTAGLSLRDGAAPTVQNNTIAGGAGSVDSYAIFMNNQPSPIIQYNTLKGGAGSNISAAIYGDGNDVFIQHNDMYGGSGQNSYGVQLTVSNSRFFSNNVFGGSGASSTGMFVSGGDALLQNNLIHAGLGDTSIGVESLPLTSIMLRNNTIQGGNGSTRAAGVVIDMIIPVPVSEIIQNNIIMTQHPNGTCIDNINFEPIQNVLLQNNVLYCAGALYRNSFDAYQGVDNNGNLTTNVNGSGTALDPAGSKNLAVDPFLVDLDGADNNPGTMADNDWHLSADTPAVVISGGLNGNDVGWVDTTDHDDIVRPPSDNPWTIGAYQTVSALPGIANLDHATVIVQACASSACHDGTSSSTYKSVSHPQTTELCEACHSTRVWIPTLLPFDHTQTSESCMYCHNGTIAQGKPISHIVTAHDCNLCHSTSFWITPP